MNKLLFAITLTMASTAILCGQTTAQSRRPDGLMIECLEGATVTGIVDAVPEFSWVVHSSHKNDMQSAFHLLVAGTPEQLDENRADMWDSGQVHSKSSIHVPYQGKALLSNQSYYWKVKTQCALGGESSWSAVQTFKTGIVSAEYATARYPLMQTVVPPISVTRKAADHYLIDFGRVAFGYLRLELDCPEAGHQMEIHLGERGDINGVNRRPGGTIRYYRLRQSLASGVNKLDIHPPKDSRNTGNNAIKLPPEIGIIGPFRYVELVNCPVELDKTMIEQVSVHYPFNEKASRFVSSDPILNDIWALCKYSMKATSFCGVYVDGDRERIPYEADAYINQLSHYAVDREYTLARYSHEYLLKNPTWPTEWKQHSVLMAWADFMYTGNKESLAQNYELLKAEKTLEHLARPDGLLDTRGLRDIVDWPSGERDGYDFKEVNTVVNAFYYQTLLQMVDIAAALGRESEVTAYQQKAAAVKAAFNAVLFDADQGLYVDGQGSRHASLHANMMPLAFGLVPEDRLDTVADFVVSKGMACSVYGAQYLLEALYKAGRPEVALKLMTSRDIRSWYNMLRVGSTITLEAWDNTFKPNQDWNHAWGAAPGNIISRYLLGVRPIEPGFGKVLIQPQPGTLKQASAVVPTIRGPIELSFENDPAGPFELRVDIPANMTARVGLPLRDKQSTTIIVDGEETKALVQGKFLFVDGIGSGSHVLICKGASQ